MMEYVGTIEKGFSVVRPLLNGKVSVSSKVCENCDLSPEAAPAGRTAIDAGLDST